MPATCVQLALNASDLAAAKDLYADLIGVQQHEQCDGYADLAVEDPARAPHHPAGTTAHAVSRNGSRRAGRSPSARRARRG